MNAIRAHDGLAQYTVRCLVAAALELLDAQERNGAYAITSGDRYIDVVIRLGEKRVIRVRICEEAA